MSKHRENSFTRSSEFYGKLVTACMEWYNKWSDIQRLDYTTAGLWRCSHVTL